MQDSLVMGDSFVVSPVEVTAVAAMPLWPFLVVLLIGLAAGMAFGWWWRGRRSHG